MGGFMGGRLGKRRLIFTTPILGPNSYVDLFRFRSLAEVDEFFQVFNSRFLGESVDAPTVS